MMAGKSPSGSRSWLLVAARRWFFAEPAMTIFMQGDLFGGKRYQAHGRNTENPVAGKPDAVKAACPVWWGAHGTGPFTRWYLAGCLPNGDIKACFDRLDHDVLLKRLAEKIHDNRFLRLIKHLLQAGYLEEWRYHTTLSGAPQGGIVSPILSNIYLDQLDHFIHTHLIPHYTRGLVRRDNPAYRRYSQQRATARKKGEHQQAHQLLRRAQQLPSRDPNDPTYRRLRYIRYADDVRHFTHNEILLAEKEGSEESDLRVISPT